MAKKAAKKTAVKKTAAKKVATKRKANPALMKPLTPSATLAAIIGSKPTPRGQIVKKLWDYIKANKLQDEKDKRNINADAKLKALFGGKSKITMFEMAKHVAANVS
jgi:chromatin remodeling complex protein RSC6